MKYTSRLVLFISFLLCLHPMVHAQQDKDLQNFYADKMKANGVIVTSDVTAIPYVDIDRISKYSFDAYRAYDSRAKVKLKHGPTIELASITERAKAGISIDNNLVARKKTMAADTHVYKNESMPIVDVGIGVKAPERRKDKTVYFAQPTK